MDWTQFAIFFMGVGGLFMWNRVEARSDARTWHAESAADRRDMLTIIREMKEEMKDFHGRLERHDAEFKAHIMYHHGNKNE